MEEKDKDNNSSVGTNLAAAGMTSTYACNLDHLHYDHHPQHEQYQLGRGHDQDNNNNNTGRAAAPNMAAAMDDYMLSHSSSTSALVLPPPVPPPPPLDHRLCFADHVMQFADFGPKLALNHHHQHKNNEHALQDLENNNDHNNMQQDDPNNYHVHFLKFPVLQAAAGGDHMPAQDDQHLPPPPTRDHFHEQQEEEELRQLQLIQGELGGAYHDHDQHGTAAGSGRHGGHGITSILSPAATTQDHDMTMSNNNNNNNNNPAATAAAIVNTTITNTTTAAADDPMISIIKNMQLVSSTSNSNVKKKRPRSVKTSEEVESQRMTHIAVERNRRKQMNEHLRVLRSLMPTSYVQRGDQASIIGGAIEFVRELEQLLQCLESQKRRRLYGTDQATAAGVIAQPSRPTLGGAAGDDDPSSSLQGGFQQQQQHDHQQQHPPILMFPPPPMLPYNASGDMIMSINSNNHDQLQQHVKLVDNNNNNLDIMSAAGTGSCIREDMAESKSCIADVEVKMLGFDALIKVLSRRRPGQLIKLIAALEDLHFNILHTNITTIEQTVLYSFNIKVASDSGFTAEEIASSVQQIFTFIHANTNTTSM